MYHEIGTVDESVTARLLEMAPAIEFKDGSGYRILSLASNEADEVNVFVSGVVGEPVCNPKFVAIKPSGVIHMHADHSGSPRAGRRYHIVLQTNPYSFGYHAGEVQRLELGRMYLMDERGEHASVNWGKETRIHFICDAEGNR